MSIKSKDAPSPETLAKWNAKWDKARNMSLIHFLEQEGKVQFRKAGTQIRGPFCPECGLSPDKHSDKCKIHEDKSWRCYRCGEFGDIVTATQKIHGVDSRWDALHLLLNNERAPIRLAIRTEHDHEEVVRQNTAIKLCNLAFLDVAQNYRNAPAPLGYLHETRGISLETIKRAQQLKMLGFLGPMREVLPKLEASIGRDTLSDAGYLSKETGYFWPNKRPILFFLPGMNSIELRVVGQAPEGKKKIISKGRRQYPYFWPGSHPDGEVYIAEGFIDMLSMVDLGCTSDIIALPGAGSFDPDWFKLMQEQRNYSIWNIATDNDFAKEGTKEGNVGKKTAHLIYDHLQGLQNQDLGIKDILIQLPADGINDWNELLLDNIKRQKNM